METKAIDTVELVRRHRILKGSSLKEAYEAVKDGWYENAPAEQIASLLSVNKQLLEALEDLLMHCGIADAAPEDKDDIDHRYESAARAAIAKATGAA